MLERLKIAPPGPCSRSCHVVNFPIINTLYALIEVTKFTFIQMNVQYTYIDTRINACTCERDLFLVYINAGIEKLVAAQEGGEGGVRGGGGEIFDLKTLLA